VTPRTLIGIDYGERRIGIAVAEGSIAVPVSVIAHEGRESDLDRVADAVRERHADAVVVGLPLLPSGDEGDQARRCRRFGDALARRIDAPVVYQDETLSSVAAESAAREGTGRRSRTALDDLAAVNILQAYIDGQEPGA
jgi:putative Holliday junction resolvase